MANAAVNRRLEAPELLLRDLKETVAFLLDISVFKRTVFHLGSGLQLLHSRVKSILSHGTRVNHYLVTKYFDLFRDSSYSMVSLLAKCSQINREFSFPDIFPA